MWQGLILCSFLSILRGISSKENNECSQLPEIRVLGDPILSLIAREVTMVEILNDPLIQDAIKAGHQILSDFRQKHGYGRAIAAPQFGYSLQMICLNLGTPITLFNPNIIEKSDETFLMWDDCLSFPNLMVCVQRHVSISIEYQDEQGDRQRWNNLPKDISELLQHEIDHLHGVLAVDIAMKPGRCRESECQSIIPRSEWLQDKEKYEQWL
jgi:peptide deformylase